MSTEDVSGLLNQCVDSYNNECHAQRWASKGMAVLITFFCLIDSLRRWMYFYAGMRFQIVRKSCNISV